MAQAKAKAKAPVRTLNLLSEAEFRRTLKAEPLRGGYLFFGEEDYMKMTVLRMVQDAVCPDDDPMAAFNSLRLDGLDLTAARLLDAMAAPPMGAERKLITVTGVNFNTLRAADTEALLGALAVLPEYPYALLILSVGADALDAGSLPRSPSALLCRLSELLQPVYFERNTPQKLYGWVQKHYRHDGVTADEAACRETVSFCGRNMFTLASEIDKIAFYALAHGSDTVTGAHIRAAGTPAVEYDAFAFANAVMERRQADALAVLQEQKLRRVEPLMVLSEVSRVLASLCAIRTLADAGHTGEEIAASLRMNPYQVKLYLRVARAAEPGVLPAAVDACAQADAALKRSAADGYQLIERLICSL